MLALAAGSAGPLGKAGAFVASVWASLPIGGRIAVIVVAAALLLWLLGLLRRRLGRARRRTLLWIFSAVSLASAAGLGWWAHNLPEPRGSYFVMWHQLVRVGAALGATGFVLGTLGLMVPWMLNRLERVGFVNFVAVRHVRLVVGDDEQHPARLQPLPGPVQQRDLLRVGDL